MIKLTRAFTLFTMITERYIFKKRIGAAADRLYRTALRAVITALSLITFPVHAEFIFKDDGSIFEAKIISQTATRITVKKPNGKTETIPGKNILRIREKNTVRKNLRLLDMQRGTLFGAHIVDESGAYYSLRVDLGSPDEFLARRDNILILGESLQNTADIIPGVKDATVQWKELPGAAVYYLCLSGRKGSFEQIIKTSKTSYTVTGLKGSTPYRVQIIAVDEKGTAYGPSKETEFATLNTPPSPPSHIKVSVLDASIQLTWNASADEDGIVTMYNIYEFRNSVPVLIGTSKENSFTVKDGDTAASRIFIVKSADDKNFESSAGIPVKTREPRTYLYRAEAFVLYPFGQLADSYSWGRGLFLALERQKLIKPEISLSLAPGIISFKGKSGSKGELFPVLGDIRYGYAPTSMLSVWGSFAAGPAYYGGIDGEARPFSNGAFFHLMRGGAEIQSGSFSVSLLTGWGGFAADGNYRYFLGASLSAGAVVDF